jgi:hypothetical protein
MVAAFFRSLFRLVLVLLGRGRRAKFGGEVGEGIGATLVGAAIAAARFAEIGHALTSLSLFCPPPTTAISGKFRLANAENKRGAAWQLPLHALLS